MICESCYLKASIQLGKFQQNGIAEKIVVEYCMHIHLHEENFAYGFITAQKNFQPAA